MLYKLSIFSVVVLMALSFCDFPCDGYATKAKRGKKAQILKKNDIDIFRVVLVGDSDQKAFVSLSDIYHDTLPVPAKYIANQKNIAFKDLKHVELDNSYRAKLTSETKISETDTMFLYDYKYNKLAKIPVKQLKAVAYLTPYAHKDQTFSYSDYRIGFELDKNVLQQSLANYYDNVFVYLGNKNPFTQEKMQLVRWQQINAKEFPKTFSTKGVKKGNYTIGKHYKFKSANIIYYVQDILFNGRTEKRRLIAVDSSSNKIMVEKEFSTSEGISLAPLNFIEENDLENQWAGNLFKNKPPIIFGFEYHSFGCPSLILVGKTHNNIPINCDNRH